jgi:hypothetical protein
MRFLVLALALVTFTAGAADVQVNWTYPSLNADGSALTLANIASTRVEHGSCSGSAFGVKAGEVVVLAPAATTTFTLAPGTHCFRAYTRTVAAVGGLESGPSGVVSKVVPFSPPNPPVITVVNIVAYEIQQHPVYGARLGRMVGTVPLGTACGVKVTGNYYEVPLDRVNLSKMPKSAIVVAACG